MRTDTLRRSRLNDAERDGVKAAAGADPGDLIANPYDVLHDYPAFEAFNRGLRQALRNANLMLDGHQCATTDPDLPRATRRDYPDRRHGDKGYVTTEGTWGDTPAGCYAYGYAIGSVATLSDDLPNARNTAHPDATYNGVQDALTERGLEVSMFGRTIERTHTSNDLVDMWWRAIRDGRRDDARHFSDEAYRIRHVEMFGTAPARAYAAA